ncbi:hypothetical protein B296_00020120 [Ensete ventricosum]|uniref:Uncharacterized protein n=1 Tax=Ensete ventricosum TaxID=4639 RepID=A0A427A1Y9_ENSVE|nr:hypothetical protein B296_00020120 [Ensete ventricosum]
MVQHTVNDVRDEAPLLKDGKAGIDLEPSKLHSLRQEEESLLYSSNAVETSPFHREKLNSSSQDKWKVLKKEEEDPTAMEEEGGWPEGEESRRIDGFVTDVICFALEGPEVVVGIEDTVAEEVRERNAGAVALDVVGEDGVQEVIDNRNRQRRINISRINRGRGKKAPKQCDRWGGRQQNGAWQLAEAQLRLGSSGAVGARGEPGWGVGREGGSDNGSGLSALKAEEGYEQQVAVGDWQREMLSFDSNQEMLIVLKS